MPQCLLCVYVKHFFATSDAVNPTCTRCNWEHYNVYCWMILFSINWAGSKPHCRRANSGSINPAPRLFMPSKIVSIKSSIRCKTALQVLIVFTVNCKISWRSLEIARVWFRSRAYWECHSSVYLTWNLNMPADLLTASREKLSSFRIICIADPEQCTPRWAVTDVGTWWYTSVHDLLVQNERYIQCNCKQHQSDTVYSTHSIYSR